jgi:hypothetical protein
MDEEKIKKEIRLYVLEMFVSKLWALVLLSTAQHDPEALFAQVREQMLQGARKLTFPTLQNAAASDLVSAELEASAEAFLRMVETEIAQVRGRQQK